MYNFGKLNTPFYVSNIISKNGQTQIKAYNHTKNIAIMESVTRKVAKNRPKQVNNTWLPMHSYTHLVD